MPFIPLKFIAVREKRDTSTLKLCTSLVRLSHQIDHCCIHNSPLQSMYYNTENLELRIIITVYFIKVN